MKKPIVFVLLLSLFGAAFPTEAAADYSAEAMIVMEPLTGTVLYEKNADERMLIASTTKIVTAMVVLTRCKLTEKVTVTAEQAGIEGSAMYLVPGESYTVEELLLGMMLASGNNAAAALAEHTAGSVASFASLMNESATALGLKNTHFSNPHGLDAEDHYSSARDMALLTAQAMKDPTFCRLFSTRSAVIRGVVYQNHNKLLRFCEGCIGGKTGYTKAAGRTLVSCAERNGMRLLCVTLSDPADWEDHSTAYEEAFRRYAFFTLPQDAWSYVSVISGTCSRVSLSCTVPALVVPADAALRWEVELPGFVFAPVADGEILGSVRVYADETELMTASITAAGTIPADERIPLRPWERFCQRWAQLFSRRKRDILLMRTDTE